MIKSVYLNIYSKYPEKGKDEMYGTSEDERWPRCSPASLRDQTRIVIEKHFHWRERTNLPLPKHLLNYLHQFQPQFQPLLHFHFHHQKQEEKEKEKEFFLLN